MKCEQDSLHRFSVNALRANIAFKSNLRVILNFSSNTYIKLNYVCFITFVLSIFLNKY